jgi:hypothetical protein
MNIIACFLGAPEIALKITPYLIMVTLSSELKPQRKFTLVLNNISLLKITWCIGDGSLSIPQLLALLGVVWAVARFGYCSIG